MLDIIKNIEANEELYANIELRLTCQYRRAERDDRQGNETAAEDTHYRLVQQGNRLFLSERWMSTDLRGKTHTFAGVHGFDGEKSRVVSNEELVNIHHGRFADPRVHYPNAFIFKPTRFVRGRKLSALLRSAKWEGASVRVQLDGQDTIDGIECFVLRIVAWADEEEAQAPPYNLLWIAPTRNYLPLKRRDYAPNYSKEIPKGESTYSQLREISPGVWFPFEMESISNLGLAAAQGRTELAYRERCRFQEVTLDPDYDDALFRDIPMPEYGTVYELVDGKVAGRLHHKSRSDQHFFEIAFVPAGV